MDLAVFVGFIALLVVVGVMLHRRQAAKWRALLAAREEQQKATLETLTPKRFRVVSIWYDGENGGDARRALEARIPQHVDGERLEFWDNDDCRGRYPA